VSQDLDGRDFAEVRRRVVDPVVQALMTPAEVQSVLLQYGGSSWWSFDSDDDGPDRAEYVWLCLIDADQDEHWHMLGYAGSVGRWDAFDVAAFLADFLSDQIVESSYGWGQLRDVDLESVLPPPRWRKAPGKRVLEMYARADAKSPVWERGTNVPLHALPVSPELLGDVAALHSTYLRLYFDSVEESGEDITTWDSLEPARSSLVERLRDELPDTFEVVRPLPRPPLRRTARRGKPNPPTDEQFRGLPSGSDLQLVTLEELDGDPETEGRSGVTGPSRVGRGSTASTVSATPSHNHGTETAAGQAGRCRASDAGAGARSAARSRLAGPAPQREGSDQEAGP